jgi:hypothetical protein
MEVTSIAISSVANAQAAAAAAAAQEAAREACMTYVRGYEHNHATVAEMREYAGCIDRLYPEPLSADAMTVLKVVVALLLVGAVAGVFYGRRDPCIRGGAIETVMMGSIIGACVTGAGMLLVAAVWFGVRLLVS